MESGGSHYHNTRLFFSGRMKPRTVLSLSPLAHSTGKGDGDMVIVPMLRKVVLGSQGFPSVAAPVHFVPRHVFILHFCGFSRKAAVRALSSWVFWAGGEDKKGQGEAVKQSRCSEDPRKRIEKKPGFCDSFPEEVQQGVKTCGMTKI